MVSSTSFLWISLAALFTISHAYSQASGPVEYKYLGIRFSIPEGWIGQENEAGYLVGSYTLPGFALLTTHPSTTIEQLREQARQGIYDQNGTMLTLTGEPETLGQNILGGEFEGSLEGQPVKAYLAGVLNPHGNGVTILAAASPGEYSSIHKNLAINLANSLEFSQPEIPPVVEEWKQALQNAKLTYRDSYFSSGSGVDVGGTIYSSGGGYSNKEEIHLCAQGYFKYNNASRVSIDQGAFGSSKSTDLGAGTWSVEGNAQGGATLRLNFYAGEIYEYTLDYQNNQTLLNGKRYYRTYASEGAEFGPDCR